MGGKRKISTVEWVHCEPCRKDVLKCENILHTHNNSRSHMRYVELLSKKTLLEEWNVRWALEGCNFFCYTCNFALDCSFTKIEKHYIDRHLGSKINGGVSDCEVPEPRIASTTIPDGWKEVVHDDNIEGIAGGSCVKEIFCKPCRKNIPNCKDNIESHNSSSGHLRFVELSSKMGTLDRWNIGWAPTGRAFICRHCDVLLGCSFAKLQSHYENHHMGPTEGESQLSVFKAFRCKKFYESIDYDFNADKGNFRVIEGPLQLTEFAGSCLGLIRHQVVPEMFSSKLYEIASDLEIRGRNTVRGTKKESSRMVMYELFNRGYSNW